MKQSETEKKTEEAKKELIKELIEILQLQKGIINKLQGFLGKIK